MFVPRPRHVRRLQSEAEEACDRELMLADSLFAGLRNVRWA